MPYQKKPKWNRQTTTFVYSFSRFYSPAQLCYNQLSLVHFCWLLLLLFLHLLLKAFGFPSNDTQKNGIFLLLFIVCVAFGLQSLAIIMIVCQMEWNGKKKVYKIYGIKSILQKPYACNTYVNRVNIHKYKVEKKKRRNKIKQKIRRKRPTGYR